MDGVESIVESSSENLKKKLKINKGNSSLVSFLGKPINKNKIKHY